MTGRNVLHATGVLRGARELHLAILRARGRRQPRASVSGERDAQSLRILGCTPTALPDHRRGAEVTLHLVMRELRARGHDARILLTQPGTSTTLGGVPVLGPLDRTRAHELAEWSDVVIGQLDARADALRLGARGNRPVAYYMHIGNVDRRALFGRPDLTVFASSVLQSQYPAIAPALVVHPPVPEADYATTRGNAITLVAPHDAKGARVFAELARRLPDREFLTVGGNGTAWAPNVVALAPVDDMREVYARTRVLLMPSAYESYGRTGLEAAASGIPAIAHPAAGIREALGDAAVFVGRDDFDAWEHAIRALDDEYEYARCSAAARARYDSLDPASELDALERALRALVTERRGS